MEINSENKPMNIGRTILGYFQGVNKKYGVLAYIASIFVGAKLMVFYKFMGVETNLIPVWLITCAIVFLIFTSFKNKWIPAVIFLLLSILIFADAVYSSFFNKYLSIGMIGAAGFLKDVQESVREVMQPKFFVLFIDCIVVFATLILAKFDKILVFRKRGFSNESERAFDAEIADAQMAEEVQESDAQMAEEVQESDAQTAEEIQESDEQIEEEIQESDAQTAEEIQESDEPIEVDSEDRKESSGFKDKVKKSAKSIFSKVTVLVLIAFMVFNSSSNATLLSIGNQELVTYHIKDILGINRATYAMSEGIVATGTYENQKDGPLFGVAEGRNLIVVQLESVQNFVIGAEYNGQEITPVLNDLIDTDSIYFDNYFQQVGSGNTSDAEFASNNSIYGTMKSCTYSIFPDNYYRGLPWLLKEKGYNTSVFHPYKKDFWNREEAYPALGFDNYYSEKAYKMTETIGMGLSDGEFFKQTVDMMQKNTPEPFYNFLITLSNHYPYYIPEEYAKIELSEDDYNTTFGQYLNSSYYTDYAIGILIDELKDAGLYDNSIIAFYGDHCGLVMSDNKIKDSMTNFLGKEYDYDTMLEVPFILHIPGSDVKETISVTGGHLDFMPTVAYLLGFEELDTLYFGRNLITAELGSGFAAEQVHMPKGSFIDDEKVFVMAKDGVFANSRAYNRETGAPVPLSLCEDGYRRSISIINESEYYLANDYLREFFEEGKSLDELKANRETIEYPEEIVVAGTGAIADKNLIGSNSLEALDVSYDAGYRFMSVKGEWTSDGRIIFLDSWDEVSDHFLDAPNEPCALEEFKDLTMKNGYTQMSSIDLITWMQEHPDAYVVVDIVEKPIDFLRTIQQEYPDVATRIIPQISLMDEYLRASHLSYQNCIYYVDNSAYNIEEILDFPKLNNVWAIAVSEEDYKGKLTSLSKTSKVYIQTDGDKQGENASLNLINKDK